MPTPLKFRPDLPIELKRIINKTLEKDRDLRYQHASEMRTDLKRLKRDTTSGRSDTAWSSAKAQAPEPLSTGGFVRRHRTAAIGTCASSWC